MNATPLPRLSVVLPNYNHARFLPACLKALLQQSAPPFEIVAVDDGSTDNSVEVLNEFASRHPSLRVYRNEQNRGVAYTVNRGVELARGDYVFPTAADDETLPGFFEKSLRLLARHPQAALSCTVCEWRYVQSGLAWHMGVGMVERPSFLSPDDMVRIARRGKLVISSSSVILRRDVIPEVGGCIPELLWHCDWFLNLSAAFRYGICVVPEPLSTVNILPNSYYTSGRRRPEHRQVLVKILELFNSPPFADIRPRIRDSGVLALFATPILRIMLGRREFRSFINLTLLRWIVWRNAELIGSKILPASIARWFLNRFYALHEDKSTSAEVSEVPRP